MASYEVIPSKRYVRDDGASASIYGACPWYSDAEKPRWKVEVVGWSVRNIESGRVGIGRAPWKSEAEAAAWADAENARLIDIAASARARSAIPA